jgi:DNA-binding NarL/FixJ family response regulator
MKTPDRKPIHRASRLHRVKVRFGLTNKELARALGSSEKSIERNLSSVR